jgi:hypothetical protein
MTTNEKVARRKLSLLALAKELNNVSKACKLIGYSRQQFYEIRRHYQTYGAEGLLDKLPGCKGAHPNRVAPEIEQAILDYSLTRPTHGPLRVAQELALQGINVSAGGVRGVWQRHDLLSKHDRLLRLEKTHREQTIIPTSCSCNWRGLSTGQPRYAGRRATALSSDCIAHCWMNTSQFVDLERVLKGTCTAKQRYRSQ